MRSEYTRLFARIMSALYGEADLPVVGKLTVVDTWQKDNEGNNKIILDYKNEKYELVLRKLPQENPVNNVINFPLRNLVNREDVREVVHVFNREDFH